MTRTKIDWCDYTWNPVTGCEHGCPYCYARRIATRFRGTKAWPNGFKPTFHPERLGEPARRKHPERIFAVSMGDLFGRWVPGAWIGQVQAAMRLAPQHRFVVLTKAPVRMAASVIAGDWPRNVMFGVTATTDGEARAVIASLRFVRQSRRIAFLSVEPIHEAVTTPQLADVDWIIVGCETGGGRRGGTINCQEYVDRERTAVEETVNAAKNAGIPVFVKGNAWSRRGGKDWPQEWPEFWKP